VKHEQGFAFTRLRDVDVQSPDVDVTVRDVGAFDRRKRTSISWLHGRTCNGNMGSVESENQSARILAPEPCGGVSEMGFHIYKHCKKGISPANSNRGSESAIICIERNDLAGQSVLQVTASNLVSDRQFPAPQVPHSLIRSSTMYKPLVSLLSLSLFLFAGAYAQDAPKAPSAREVTKGKSLDAPVTVIVTHAVKEFASWKKVYDADAPNRKAMGFTVIGVYADAKDPNLVSIIGTFPSAGAAGAFMSSPKLKEAMENAGVVGKPDVKVLTAMTN
jgi:hypothetical protein